MTVSLTGAQKEELIRALRGAFDHASLAELAEVGLGVRLDDEIAFPEKPLRELVPQIVEWAGEHERLTDLLDAVAVRKPDNAELLTLIARLSERLRGETPSDDDAAEPELPTELGAARRLYVVSTREDAALRRRLEQRLRPLIHDGRMIIVGRRQIDAGGEHDNDVNPRLAMADLAVVLASPGFITSSYLWREEGKHLVDRHYRRELRIVVVQAQRVTLAETPLDGFDILTSEMQETTDQIGDELIGMLGQLIDQRYVEDWRKRYLSSFRSRVADIDRDARGFLEPTKDVSLPHGDQGSQRRPAVGSPSATLETVMSQLRGERVFAVLGEPGSGKSMIIRRHAVALADRAFDDPVQPLPVLVKLGSYTTTTERDGATAPGSLFDFLRTSLASGRPAERPLAREIDALLRNGKIALLLDGLDEMPRRDFPARVAELRAFVNEYRHCKVVVACRVADFDATQLDVCQIRLRPFSRDDVARYLASAVPLSIADARHDAAMLCATDSRFGRVAGNPFYLALLAAARAASDYPELVSDLFADHMARALATEGAEMIGALRQDMELLAFEMSGLGAGTTAATPALLDRIAGRTTTPGSELVDRLVRAGLIRRDESTGATVFSHLRMQELLVAAHVARLPADKRLAWLRERAGEPWLEEVFVLVAREAIALDDLASWIADEATSALNQVATSTSLATDRSLEIHEVRIALLGRLSESTRFRPDTLSQLDELLSRLWVLRGRRIVPDDAASTVLRAARGELACQPRTHACLREALVGRHTELRRRAWSALASTRRPEDQRRLRLAALGQAVATNYTQAVAGDLQAVADDPRLAPLRRTVIATFVLHIVALLGSTAAIVLVTPRLSGFSGSSTLLPVAVLGLHAFLALRRQDGQSSSLQVVAGLMLTSAAIGVAAWIPGAAVRAVVPDAVIEQRATPTVVAGTAMLFAIGAAFRGDVRQLVSSWKLSLLLGGILGFAWATEPGFHHRTMVPYLLVIGANLVLFAIVLLARLEVSRRTLLKGARILAVLGGITGGAVAFSLLHWWAYVAAAFGLALVALGLWAGILLMWRLRRRALLRSEKLKGVAGVAIAIAFGGSFLASSLGALTGVPWEAIWFALIAIGAVITIADIATGSFRFVKYNTRAQAIRLIAGPCTLAEVGKHLETLVQGDLLRGSRAQVLWRLQGHAPLTRLVELVLVTVGGQWPNEPALLRALATLRDRRQRARGDTWASIDDEFSLAAVIVALFSERPPPNAVETILSQWLLEAGPQVAEELRRRLLTDPAATSVIVSAMARGIPPPGEQGSPLRREKLP